ncbi:asparagine synthase (glutamine-hydrolyzing) [Massilia sp. TWR1-2-2]|uniref:asparagine synthase (glutamine-hydrolyzing) n=1 Tax=Massilia sp. TWR1-2-2 TaxID=2804584 RepID=UPI003CEB9918
MCGISGIINKNGSPVTDWQISSINNMITHRGPDGCGLYFGRNLALGHRRLAIVDVTTAGHQPMVYHNKHVITFNGEIYNYLELRALLCAAGYDFMSGTDTEVILAAYEEWGADCVKRFNGMWAFAIYDIKKAEIFCSRDRFGVKPFYYSDTPDKLVFGSEIKQILVGAGRGAIANMAVVRDFLVEGYHGQTGDTFFKGVHSLRAGHNLIFSLEKNTFKEVKYYSLEIQPGFPEMNEGSATELVLANLIKAVTYQVRSDVKIGLCLSGGLDSSSLAGLASMSYNGGSIGPMDAVHAKSSEGSKDESEYALAVAAAAGIKLSIIQPTAAEFNSAIDEVVYVQEEPFNSPSIFMQYFVFQKAKKLGCKVMLDGQGCDELLLGYDRYYSAHLLSMHWISALREILQIKKNSNISIRAIVGNLVYFSMSEVRIWNLKRRFSFLKNEYKRDFPNIKQISKAVRNMREMQKLEIECFQLPPLLRYADKNSMRHSVEARVPFLDHNFVEVCYGISTNLKLSDGWTKHILRKAMRGVIPPNVLWRKLKFGFEAPAETWVKETNDAMVRAICDSPVIEMMCQEKLDFKKLDRAIFWRLYSIAKWEAAYSVQISPDETDLPPVAHSRRSFFPKHAQQH